MITAGEDGKERVLVDRDLCAGTGTCEQFAPEHFELSLDDDVVTVIRPQVSPAERSAVEAAVASCPMGALRVWEPSSP